MEKSWIYIDNRLLNEFWIGLQGFIEYTKNYKNSLGQISCPCRKCLNRNMLLLEEVKKHILVDSVVGINTRFCCDPSYDKWKDVPVEQRAKVAEGMLSWFDMDLSGVLRGVLYRDAGKCYRAWKNELANHFRTYGSLEQALSKPPQSIRNPEQWQKCCVIFDSKEFKGKSKTNKNNRAENMIPSYHGRKSYAQYLAEKADLVTKEPYSEIENWKDMRMREGKWTNPRAEQKYLMNDLF